MTQANKDLVIAFLNQTELDIDFRYFLAHNDFETADEIEEILQDNNAFDVEITYFGSAMEYLSNNDSSLRESLKIASEMGYEPGILNSEILASLLASENMREDWSETKRELDTFIEELEEETED